MKRALRTLVVAAALCVPLALPAQFDFGGGASSSAPWKEFKLNPNTRIKLDFKNASVDMVVSLLSRTSGITIVKDPTFKTPITVTSAKPVSLDEAFHIFSTVVSLAGYDFKKEGSLLVIRKRAEGGQGRGMAAAMMAGQEMFGGEGGSGGGRQTGQLKVYELKHASATQVARVINDVFTTVQNQQNQGQNIQLGNMNFPGAAGRRFGGGGGGGGQGGRQQPTVRASSDDFSNTVIVYGPNREQEQVEELIKRIDKPSEQPQNSRVYKLTYASALDLAPVVQNVLVSNAPRGRGGLSNQNIPFEQRFQTALRLGGTQAAFGTVAADTRTNSLVVTATDENLKIVEQVIRELDQPVVMQNSTFVMPLDNARAEQLSQLLNQAFGTRSGGSFTGTNQNQNRGQNQNNRFRMGVGGGGGGVMDVVIGRGGTRGAQPENAKELDVPLAEPGADAGPLATEVSVNQGFQFFGQGQQNRQQPARDAQGRITNIRDLAGQISVIPDPNTNSLIVVATPENAELIRAIIDQLDRIPEQVMIETIIVEATLDASSKLGVEWQFTQDRAFGRDNTTGAGSTNFGLAAAGAVGSGFRYTVTGQNFQAFVNALKTDQKFNVLSTPRIFTSNNTQAEINISQQVPYVLSQREDANGNLTFNYAFQDVGIVLTVTPRITANGYVTMDVIQTANDLQGFTSFNAPIVNQRQAQTTVSVKDGETIVLGGIIRNTVNSTVRKVPLLGDIPLLGELFKSTDRSKVKTELLVFLTPRIVRNDQEAKKLQEDTRKELAPGTQKTLSGALEKGKEGGKP